jgi:hypothetical protein
MKKDIHVLPKGDKWVVRSEQEEDDAFFATRYDADCYGRRVAKEHRTGYYLHGQDGKVQKRDSYGGGGYDGK